MNAILNHSTIKTIKQIPLFNEYSEQALLMLAETSVIRTFRKNTIVIHESDIARSVYFVLQGSVRVYRENAHGKEVTLNELGMGEMFGELAWLSNNKRSASVITKQQTKLLIIQSSELEKFYLEHPEISQSIVFKYAGQITRLSQHLETVVLENIQEKVIWAIQSYATENEGGMWVTSVTHKELACLIGASRESVSRAIQELKHSGHLKVKQGALYLSAS